MSGMLDFEFASPDLLAMDFVCGLRSFGSIAGDKTTDWPAISAFARGYAASRPLTEHEVAAVPTLLRLRTAASLVHWVGRWRQGKATRMFIHRRALDLLATDRWLRRTGNRLVEEIARVGN